MIDVNKQINAVTREVGSKPAEGTELRVVRLGQTYDTSIEDLWEACTNAERIPRWFMPVSGDLSLGGHYQLEGNASGIVEVCDPPIGFDATWEFGGEVSWIRVRLTAVGEVHTRFNLEHIAPVEGARWDEYGPGAVGVGWELGLMGLTLHIAGAGALDPHEVAAWSASAEGIEFMTRSSEAWAAASIAFGTDRDAANAAAGRTTAFYTAAPG